jgi:hypothetical protein
MILSSFRGGKSKENGQSWHLLPYSAIIIDYQYNPAMARFFKENQSGVRN